MAHHDFPNEVDPLAPARGCLFAGLGSLVLVLIIVVVLMH